MELNQVRAFLVLAEELHFGRAAQRLNVSQPPLSRQIRQLEEEIGTQLFERTSRSVKITPAGEAFRREAREMMARKDAAVAAALSAATQRSGSVRLGFVGASTYTFLPRLAEALARRAPWLRVDFQEATSVDQLEALAVERIDVGLMRPVEGVEAFESMIALREPLAIAIPASHPLAQRREFHVRLLDDQPLIGFSTGSPYLRHRMTDVFRQAGVRPRIIQEFAQSQAILSLVSAGLGLAVVPAGTASASFDNIVFRQPRWGRGDEGRYSIDLVGAWKPGTRNPARATLIELMRSLASKR